MQIGALLLLLCIIHPMPIREGQSGLFKGCRVISLYEVGEPFPIASVHFRPRRILRPARLVFIQSEPNSGQGFGRQMMREFIDRVGPGDVVTSEIVHSETWRALRHLRLLRCAYEQGAERIMEPHVLSRLPIVHFLQSSGMDVSEVTITYGKKKTLSPFRALMKEIDTNDFYTSFFTTMMRGTV